MIKFYDINKYVNLCSYSESVGWIGFYERKCEYSNELLNRSIYEFINFFKNISPKVTIITSLYKFKINNSKINSAQTELIKLGYLRNLTTDDNFLENKTSSNMMRLFKEADWSNVRKISSVVMNNDGDIAGHCFIIFETINIIIYPHDDTGFGFILKTLNQNSFEIVKSFFEHLDTNKFRFQIIDNWRI